MQRDHTYHIWSKDLDFTNPTIEGRDYEQTRFPKNEVEKSFIKLMQEFRSLGISGL